MNEGLQALPTEGKTRYRRGARSALLAALPWILVVTLIVTNIGTLLNDRAWSAGHDGLTSMIATMVERSIGSVSTRGLERASAVAEDLARQNMMLAARRKELESTVAGLRRENTEMKTKKVESDTRLQRLQAEHTGLRNQHLALEKEQSALKELSSRRARAVKTVANRISKKLAVHAGELIAELPLRAAPYVGVVTLVTGTALDIQSDCELARTLNALVLEHQEAPLDTHAVCQYTDKIPAPAQVWGEVKSRAGTLAVPVYQTVEKLYRH